MTILWLIVNKNKCCKSVRSVCIYVENTSTEMAVEKIADFMAPISSIFSQLYKKCSVISLFGWVKKLKRATFLFGKSVSFFKLFTIIILLNKL